MRSVVLYCPHLNRDLRGLHEAVPDLLIYTGLPTPRGEDGCLQSHLEIVAEAKFLGEPSVFVMEDDCAFTRHFNFNRWTSDVAWARENGYDVVLGGCTRTYDEKVVRSGMIEVSAFHSAHCIVYLDTAYDKVPHAVQPYDLSLGRDCGVKCVLAFPFVAVQAASFSGILRQPVDYVPLYHQHEQDLERNLGLRTW